MEEPPLLKTLISQKYLRAGSAVQLLLNYCYENLFVNVYKVSLLCKKNETLSCLSMNIWDFSLYFKFRNFQVFIPQIFEEPLMMSCRTLVGKHCSKVQRLPYLTTVPSTSSAIHPLTHTHYYSVFLSFEWWARDLSAKSAYIVKIVGHKNLSAHQFRKFI